MVSRLARLPTDAKCYVTRPNSDGLLALRRPEAAGAAGAVHSCRLLPAAGPLHPPLLRLVPGWGCPGQDVIPRLASEAASLLPLGLDECNDRERLLAGACVRGRTEVTVLEDKEADRPMLFNGDGGDEVEIAHMGNYFAQVVKVRTRAGMFVRGCMCAPRVRARRSRVENKRLC